MISLALVCVQEFLRLDMYVGALLAECLSYEDAFTQMCIRRLPDAVWGIRNFVWL